MTQRDEALRPRTARRQERELARARRRRATLLAALGIVLAGVVAVVGVQAFGLLGQGDAPVSWSVASHTGGPRLAVDRLTIDDGAVDYGHRVQALFRLKNVGDQPLTLGTATVTTLAGC